MAKYNPMVTSDYLVSQEACYIGKYIKTPWKRSLLDIIEMDDIPSKDKIWVASRTLPDKQLRYFAIWCAREALSLQDAENIDSRSLDVLWYVKEYADGNLHHAELSAARAEARAADSAAWAAWAAWAAATAAWSEARAAAMAADSAAWAAWAAWAAARAAATAAQAAAQAAAWAAWAEARAAARAAQIECLKRLINGENILEEK